MIKVFDLPDKMKPKHCDACGLHDATLIVQENGPGWSTTFVCQVCFDEFIKPRDDETDQYLVHLRTR